MLTLVDPKDRRPFTPEAVELLERLNAMHAGFWEREAVRRIVEHAGTEAALDFVRTWQAREAAR